MTYVCDTHAFIWAAAGDRRIGREAARIFARARKSQVDLRLSVASLWEVALSVEKGRLRIPRSWPEWLDTARNVPGLRIEPLEVGDVDHARAFRSLVDPYDRLIVGTALRLGAKLITADERITRSRAVPTVW